ncbi:ClpP/crotonase-like domain-containing protein [Fennellomyces sp. T-0311]|nr:ClpP/crotonase-like domain-containing protein [Fennellomyces sp. T-0311]
MASGRILTAAEIRRISLSRFGCHKRNITASTHLSTVRNRFALQTRTAHQQAAVLANPRESDQPDVLLYEHPNGVCEIQLNRPKKLNAINPTISAAMTESLLAWEKSNKSKMFVIKGNGDKAFCAGGDVRYLLDRIQDGAFDEIAATFNKKYGMDHLIGTLTKPYVAILNGITMGGGVGVSINAPFRIATENTLFAMPENAIGLFSDVTSSFWMPRLDGHLGQYLGLTGKRLQGSDVFYAGIATHYVPSKNLNALETHLGDLAAKSNCAVDPIAINDVIESFSANMDEEKIYSLGGNIRKAIDRCFNQTTVEEIVEALNNERVAVDWAKETAEQLSTMSPTSLKISHQMFREGARRSFIDCMRMEYQLAIKVAAEREFVEGGSATLITRTKPNWYPPTLQQVDANEIKRHYFDTPATRLFKPVVNDGHYKEYRHRRFMLPECSEILKIAEKVGRDNTIDYFLKKHNGKQGVKAKVADVLDINP